MTTARAIGTLIRDRDTHQPLAQLWRERDGYYVARYQGRLPEDPPLGPFPGKDEALEAAGIRQRARRR